MPGVRDTLRSNKTARIVNVRHGDEHDSRYAALQHFSADTQGNGRPIKYSARVVALGAGSSENLRSVLAQSLQVNKIEIQIQFNKSGLVYRQGEIARSRTMLLVYGRADTGRVGRTR